MRSSRGIGRNTSNPIEIRVIVSSERGAALILVLLVVGLIAAVASALAVGTSTETLISGSHRAARETFYAADAALDRAISVLAPMPDWSPALLPPPGNLKAPFSDSQSSIRAPDGRPFGIGALTMARQSASDGFYGTAVFGSDSPQWRPFAHAPLQQLVPPDLLVPPAYVIVWIADDGGDGDAQPAADANGTILLHAAAYGPHGASQTVEASIQRVAPGAVRLLSWRKGS